MNEIAPQDILRALRTEEGKLSSSLPKTKNPGKFAQIFMQLESVRLQIETLQSSISPESGSLMISQGTLAMRAGPEPERNRKG